MEGKIFLSIDEAAHLLGLGRTTMHGLFNDGQLKRVKIGRRTFIHKDDLAAFIEKQCGKAVAA